MSIAIIPAIALLALVVLHPNDGKREKPPEKVAVKTERRAVPPPAAVSKPNEKPVQALKVDANDMDPEKEFKAIYSYIRSVYPKISEEDARQISRYLVDYGREHDVDPKLAAALMARESAFNKQAVSSTGAKGLGQIKGFNFESLKIKDPFNIKENVYGTTLYLKTMLKTWKDKSENVSLALASYYKGAGAVKRDNGELDAKTKYYVQDILKYYDQIKTYRNRQD